MLIEAYIKKAVLLKIGLVKKTDDPVFEHEYELSTDIHIPSLKTVRTIEKKVVSNEIKRQEASRAWMDYYITAQGYSVKDLKDISRIADEYSKTNTEQQREAWCDKACSKYGRDKGVKYCIYAIKMAEAKDYVDGYKYFTIEQGLARAPGIKSSIIKELKNLGYNAMYDNASIGVNSDGEYHKRQEGVEPLIIFDGKSTLRETGVNKVTKDEQKRALDTWFDWARERDKALEKFKDTTWG